MRVNACWCCGAELPPYSGKSPYWKSTLTYYCPECDVTGTVDSDRPKSQRFQDTDRIEVIHDPRTRSRSSVVDYVDFSDPARNLSSPA